MTVSLSPPSPVERMPLSNVVVATLRDVDPAGTASDYMATITWGDGATSVATAAAGTITPNADGSFSILGSHTYTNDAIVLSFSVVVRDAGGAEDSKSPRSTCRTMSRSSCATPRLEGPSRSPATATSP